jgi:hypothetical protein
LIDEARYNDKTPLTGDKTAGGIEAKKHEGYKKAKRGQRGLEISRSSIPGRSVNADPCIQEHASRKSREHHATSFL